MTTTFSIDVSYRQICVFNSCLSEPFNDWAPQHIAQGFAWRPGSVSFQTILASGPHNVTVSVQARTDSSGVAARRIIVPFEVDEDGKVEVASISSSHSLQIAPGRYSLLFQLGEGPRSTECDLVLSPSDKTVVSVSGSDSELTSRSDFLMIAQPA
jgi:hypothetical protein